MNHRKNESMDQFLLLPAALFPVDAPPLFDEPALVHSGGKILAVGPAAKLRPQFSNGSEIRLPNTALLPGLINAHCHLELTHLRNQFPPSHFVDWVKSLLQSNQALTDKDQVAANSVCAGVEESLRSGVTTVGDITKHVASSRAVLGQGPIRAVSFGEITAIGARRAGLADQLALCADSAAASSTMTLGLSPHAPYTVEGPALRQIIQYAQARKLPLTMHLSELAEEAEFLETLHGRLREAWDLGGTAHLILDDQIPRFAGGPIRWAQHYGVLDAANHVPVVLAHVNYCDDSELQLLAASKASVVYCPRTRNYFGHDERSSHRYRSMLAAGINVCLGTDSLASNPDLHLLREAQFLLRKDSVDAEVLLRMMTLNAAAALGVQGQLGSLTPHKSADMIALPYPPTSAPDRILTQLIEDAPLPSAVWIAGKAVIPKGR